MELSNFNKKLEGLQNLIINNNDIDGLSGDGKELVDNEDFPISHDFSDQLYMRKMLMKKGSFVVSAYHHTDHFWFLLSGRIFINTQSSKQVINLLAAFVDFS